VMCFRTCTSVCTCVASVRTTGLDISNFRNPASRDVLGGYPKNSDNYPNTCGVFNTFKYTVRAQRDSDALCK
jgi:hypothetical protein